jgi:hypothetical protein
MAGAFDSTATYNIRIMTGTAVNTTVSRGAAPAFALAALVGVACTTAPRSDSSGTQENRLTTTELLSANARTAYEAVERLRRRG